MNQEQLCKFCDHKRANQEGPFSYGEYTYATNGYLLLRVPRLADVPGREALNEKAAVMFDVVDYPAANAALIEIPDFAQPEPEICTTCKGTGKISKCPECDGDGEVTLDNDYHSYECECLTCSGEGRVLGNDSICYECNGDGKKKTIDKIPVGMAFFSSHYLIMLKELPGMKLAPTEPEKANYFKWDEGDGLLMPIRA